MSIPPRVLFLLLFGFGLWLSFVLERRLRALPLSTTIIFVALGYAAFALPLGLPALTPEVDSSQTNVLELVTEFIVVAALMGAGLAIDRAVSWRGWRQVASLLLVTMPLTIAAVAGLGWWAGLSTASALLLGACLAPTDPVLAREVQVDAPGGDAEESDVRFDLTVEAGLNDGLAFPFVHMALAVAAASGMEWLPRWLGFDLAYRVFAGVAVGALVGNLGGRLAHHEVSRRAADREGELEEAELPDYGVLVMAGVFSAYALAEAVHGYGFLAVFVAAVAARQRELGSEHHRWTHHFIEQAERVVTVGMLYVLGGLAASGVLDALTWRSAAVGLALLFVVRPAAGMLALIGRDLSKRERAVVSFFGVRGVGTVYYLAYAQTHGLTEDAPELWAIATFTILASVVVHGVAATPMLRWARAR